MISLIGAFGHFSTYEYFSNLTQDVTSLSLNHFFIMSKCNNTQHITCKRDKEAFRFGLSRL
jgi:hypothetical protein